MSEPSYHLPLLNTEAIVVSNNKTEIRKILQRELEPYVNNIKKEIKLSLDHFHKEVDYYNTFLPEIKDIKEAIEGFKRSITYSNEANDKKLVDQREKILELNRLNSEVKDQYQELKSKMASIEIDYDNVYDKLSICEKMKINYDSFDSKIKDYYIQVEQKIKQTLDSKINDNSISIEDLKKNHECVGNAIARLESEQLQLENQIKELQEKSKAFANQVSTNYKSSITNTDILLKNNGEIKACFSHIEKKLTELNNANIHFNTFKKEITLLKENSDKQDKDIREIIQTLNKLINWKHDEDFKQCQMKSFSPININPRDKSQTVHYSEIASKLYIIEEMLNEHHKLLIHHNNKCVKSNDKISCIKVRNLSKSTKEVPSDDALNDYLTINNEF